MLVTFKMGEPLWRAVGKREVAVDVPAPATLDDALAALAAAYPQAGEELHLDGKETDFYYSLFVNDRLVLFSRREQTSLADGDVVHILLPLAGGV